MKHLTHAILSFSLLFSIIFITPANAQQNKHQEQPQRSHYGSMPHRGMTMVEVKQRFGQPLNMLAPVGNPPITRWNYDGFSVIFEYHFVIHAIASAD